MEGSGVNSVGWRLWAMEGSGACSVGWRPARGLVQALPRQ